MSQTALFRLASLILLGLSTTGGPAHAGSISLTTVAQAAISPGFFDQDVLNETLNPFTDLTLISSAAGTFNQANMSSSLSVLAYAFIRASNGTLSLGTDAHAAGSSTLLEGPVVSTGHTGSGGATVVVNDGLTVVGGPTSGLLALNFDVSGALSTTFSASAVPSFASASASGTLFVNTNTNPQNVLTSSIHSATNAGGPTTSTFPDTWTVLVPFMNGSASMGLHLNSSAQTIDQCSRVGGGTASCTQEALSALGSTFTLGFIQVLDSNGQLVPGAYVTGDSGITYNHTATPTAPVPEPASLSLFGGALAMLGVLRRKLRP